jgi:hypothetical protein
MPNEPTHFLHLIKNKFNLSASVNTLIKRNAIKTALSEYIFAQANIKQSDFYKFKKSTLKYRNKNLIHREHDPKKVHDKCMHRSNTEMIVKSAFTLYQLIINISAFFPEQKDSQNQYKFPYAIFTSRTQLSTYFLKSLPKDLYE